MMRQRGHHEVPIYGALQVVVTIERLITPRLEIPHTNDDELMATIPSKSFDILDVYLDDTTYVVVAASGA